MVWVLDAQDDYFESVGRLTDTILQLQQSYPDIKYTVFIHKTDSLSQDYKEDVVNNIEQKIMDDLNDAGLENPPINFYPTSVYDHSIYEALSKVLQLLNPQLPTFESMLNTLAASCKLQKVYLFDVLSKLYIASDTSPIDMAGYTLCSDYIDTIVDLSEIYSWERPKRKAIENGDTGHNGGVQQDDNGSAQRDDDEEEDEEEEGGSESFISGVRGTCLYLKEMNK